MRLLQVFLLTIHTTATAFQHDPPIFAVGEVRRNLCTWEIYILELGTVPLFIKGITWWEFKMRNNVYFHQQ